MTAACMPDMWMLLSDMDLALNLARQFAKAFAEYPGPTALIGDSARIIPVTSAKKPRARHAATIGAPTVTAPESETVFTMAVRTQASIDLHLTFSKYQWLVIILY